MRSHWYLPIALLISACGGLTPKQTERADYKALAQRVAEAGRALDAHAFAAAGERLDPLQADLERWRTRTPDDLEIVALLSMVHHAQAQRLRGLEAVENRRTTYCPTPPVTEPRAAAIQRHAGEARSLLRLGCERGSADACANLGVALLTDVCGARDGMVEAYQKGCAGGVTRACTELGNFHAAGQFVAADPGRAKTYYQRSCDGGDATGCAHLGIAYDRGEGVEQDGERALTLYRDACTAGSPVGCNALGLLYQRGRYVEADINRARALFETACARKHPHACTRLGEFHFQGVAGLEADPARAAELFNRGCIARSAQGCFALGVMNERGMFEEGSMARATRLYSMACELGHPSGCFNIGNGYMLGDHLPQDFTRALQSWKRACDSGHRRACMMVLTHDENGPIRR